MANPLLKTRQIADLQVTNGKIASDVARTNLLTNPGLEIWQRGNSFAPTNGALAWIADGWMVWTNGGCTLTTTRETTITDGSPNGVKIVSTGGSAGSQSGSIYCQTMKELAVPLRGKTVTFSMRARTAVASTVNIRLWNNVGVFATGPTHTGDDTWQTLTVTGTVPAGTTDFHPEIQTIGNTTMYADNATLVVGAVPMDYVPLHPADDLARCMRYYELLNPGSFGNYMLMGQAAGAGNAYAIWPFKVQKYTTPVITISGTAWQVLSATGGANAAGTLANIGGNLQSTFMQITGASGLVAGNATMISPVSGSNQVAAEANP